jgi:hypothetical protein
VASPADYWAVTNDNPTTTSDNTLAHVIDGQGGAVKANLFQVGGGTIPTDTQDNVVWGWTVTIPANSTVGLLSVEVQQATLGLDSVTDAGQAAAVANSYQSAPLSTLYAGVSNADAVNVVNWPHPPPPPVKHKKKCKKKHHKRSAASAKKHKKCKKKHKK